MPLTPGRAAPCLHQVAVGIPELPGGAGVPSVLVCSYVLGACSIREVLLGVSEQRRGTGHLLQEVSWKIKV